MHRRLLATCPLQRNLKARGLNAPGLSGSRAISFTSPRLWAEPPQSSSPAPASVDKGKQKADADPASNSQDVTANTEDAPLPLLQRPPGVRERPTTERKTWAQTRDELMDQEKRMEKRRHLCAYSGSSRVSKLTNTPESRRRRRVTLRT